MKRGCLLWLLGVPLPVVLLPPVVRPLLRRRRRRKRVRHIPELAMVFLEDRSS